MTLFKTLNTCSPEFGRGLYLKCHGKSYNKGLGDKAKPIRHDFLCAAVDSPLKEKPADLEVLLKLLADDRYEIKQRKKAARKR